METEIIGGYDWANQLTGPGGLMLAITVGVGAVLAKDAIREHFRPTPEELVRHDVKKKLREYAKNKDIEPVPFINGVAGEWARLARLRPGGEYSTPMSGLLGIKNPFFHKFSIREENNDLIVVHKRYKDLLDELPTHLVTIAFTVDEFEEGQVGRIQVDRSDPMRAVDLHLREGSDSQLIFEIATTMRNMIRHMRKAP